MRFMALKVPLPYMKFLIPHELKDEAHLHGGSKTLPNTRAFLAPMEKALYGISGNLKQMHKASFA